MIWYRYILKTRTRFWLSGVLSPFIITIIIAIGVVVCSAATTTVSVWYGRVISPLMLTGFSFNAPWSSMNELAQKADLCVLFRVISSKRECLHKRIYWNYRQRGSLCLQKISTHLSAMILLLRVTLLILLKTWHSFTEKFLWPGIAPRNVLVKIHNSNKTRKPTSRRNKHMLWISYYFPMKNKNTITFTLNSAEYKDTRISTRI